MPHADQVLNRHSRASVSHADQGSNRRPRASASRGDSGKTDSARTFFSLLTHSLTGRKARDKKAAAETADGIARAEPGREELWTRGVDPADVEIMRDTRGRPVVLGRGAYAVVYLGRWQATLVAVKVMLAGDSDAAQLEVKAEADILRGLRHPNVVLLMAICISPGQQVGMELHQTPVRLLQLQYMHDLK
jgi:hypothetical protein